MTFTFGPRRGHLRRHLGGDAAGRPADPGRARPLRGLRPPLPLALRPPLQLRADVGPPRRLDLLRARRRRRPLRRARLRARRPGPAGRRPRSATRPATRPWACTRCGRCATRWRAVADPALLPASLEQRLRLEDLLGFRRNPITATPLFRALRRPGPRRPPDAGDARSSSSPPAPPASASPAPSASASAPPTATAPTRPRVHIVEGEGGLTPGRVAEALAAAGTASLANVVVHLDWNQASIDSRPRLPRGRRPRRLRAVGPAGALLPPRLERRSTCPTATTSSRSSRRSGTR